MLYLEEDNYKFILNRMEHDIGFGRMNGKNSRKIKPKIEHVFLVLGTGVQGSLIS